MKNGWFLLLQLSIGVLFLINNEAYGQKKPIANPYLSLKYDSVDIYDFEFQNQKHDFIPIIDKKGTLAPTVKKAIKLDLKTATELSVKIGLTSSYGQSTAF